MWRRMLTYIVRNRKIVGRSMRSVAIGFVVFIVAGNLTILGANLIARAMLEAPTTPSLPGIANLEAVDDHVWRGAAPSETGYRALASHGVGTVVDLRAEEDVAVDEQLLKELDIDFVSIPLRDGQTPTPGQVGEFLAQVRKTDKRVFVHCGAGVGRTGTMAASYLVSSGQAEPLEALGRNLAVGPPSLEQITFVADLAGRGAERPPAMISFVSRILDGPRRAWVHLSSAYE
ncbi:MAG: dual specificity protein phosphatase family protein [Actinomycetota bacterium]|nr:dual specificity protein phosphatase family protein [Actinomycetota bacterium]